MQNRCYYISKIFLCLFIARPSLLVDFVVDLWEVASAAKFVAHFVIECVDKHLFLVGVGLEHARVGWQLERAKPDRVDGHLAMEEFYGSFQVCNGHKHVLDHMLSFIQSLQSFPLSQLEQ